MDPYEFQKQAVCLDLYLHQTPCTYELGRPKDPTQMGVPEVRMRPWDVPGMTVSPQAEHCEEKAVQ